jgi:predicted outer membrane repeat protein
MSAYTLVLAMLCTAVAGGATWTVPGDVQSIQEGIDLSAPGDTVLVAGGTYYTNNLVMKSGVTLLGEGSPEDVVVDALMQGMIIDVSDTNGNTRLENMTFSRGTGLSTLKGAVHCVNSDAVFVNCIFRNNQTEKDGGGFYCADSSPTFMNCEFLDNLSLGVGGGFSGRRSSPLMINCVFRDNVSQASGGGLFFSGSGSTPRLQKCVIENNTSYQGGGFYTIGVSLEMAGCEIRDNFASVTGGGGYLFLGSALEAHTTIFATNATAGVGKAVYATAGESLDLYCCTIDTYSIAGGIIPSFFYDGCRALGSTELSWGQLKTLYR